MAFPNFYKPLACLAVVKVDSQDFYDSDSPNFYKANTCFAVVKTNFPNFYKLLTHFAVVKTESPSPCMPPTRFYGAKRTLRVSEGLLITLWG